MAQLYHLNIKQEENEELSVRALKHVKKEEEAEDGIVKQVQLCSKVKKEEESGECIKLEWDGDECDCEKCRVERQIKVEFNQNNAIKNSLQQGNSSPWPSSETEKGVPSQSSVCKRVKKEEEEYGELIGQWDEDCDCDDCRRMRLKAIRLKQTSAMENRGSGADDDYEYVLVGNDGNMAVDDQIGDEDGDELDLEGEQSGDGQESSENQMSDVDDETEIDDEEYEMEVGGEESQTVVDAPIETTLPHRNGQTRKIVRQSARHLKRKQTDQDQDIVTESTTNPIRPKLAQSNRHLQCRHCHKSFDRNSFLQRHLRVHTGERPFHCDQCDKRFNRNSTLTRHQLIHQNVKLCRCDQCDKQFRVKCDLIRHQLIHQNIKPFQCDQCDKGFNRNSNLTKHQLIHQNIKNFRCQECEKQFSLKQHLNSHLLIHYGERFTCQHCDKSFTTSDNRKKHEQAIHLQVKPYRCKQCGHTFAYLSHLIRHIRIVHFGLPHTIKEQRALDIIDDRDPKELVERL